MVTVTGGIVRKPGDGTHFMFWSGEEFIWKVTGSDTDGVLDMGELVVEPGIAVPEHIHHRNDETFYILEGRLSLAVEGDVHDLEPGSFVFVPRGVRHMWRNVEAERARILLTFTPGGMDGYFAEVNPLLQEPMDLKRILPVCAKYGYELVGPVPDRP